MPMQNILNLFQNEKSVDDLEAFAEDINADSEQDVLAALYKKCC